MFINISCSLFSVIINFCTAAPATIKIHFLKLAMACFSLANGPSSASPKSGTLINSFCTSMAGPIKSNLPFMARFKTMSTVKSLLISLVPS